MKHSNTLSKLWFLDTLCFHQDIETFAKKYMYFKLSDQKTCNSCPNIVILHNLVLMRLKCKQKCVRFGCTLRNTHERRYGTSHSVV